MSNIVQEILKWSRDLPGWQRDAIRRIFESGELSTSDIDELVNLAKIENGIGNGDETAKPLRSDQVPVKLPVGDLVRLLTIKNLENVNAIAHGQSISFAKEGLTVVYGDNGAGKSGYSRVLKRACRARDQKEDILPNAELPIDQRGTPQASFEIELNRNVVEEIWRQGDTAPSTLSSIAVFDTHCARVYLDEENVASFVPYGLDIPTKLAAGCDQVKNRLNQEAKILVYKPERFRDLSGDHAVGHATSRLPAAISVDEIKMLGTLSDKENKRWTALEEVMKLGDPAAQARLLRSFKGCLEVGFLKAGRIYKVLNEKNIRLASAVNKNWHIAKSAVELAARALSDYPDLLPGTCISDSWRVLYDAARSYSEECAYPGHEFPYLGPGARCPLCQQTLVDGTERLRRLDAFVKDKAEQNERLIREQREKAIQSFHDPELSHPLFDNEIIEQIRQNNADLAELFSNEQGERQVLIKSVLASFDSGDWDAIKGMNISLEEHIRQLLKKVEAEIAVCEQAAKGGQSIIEVELNGLRARDKLASRLDDVIGAIEQQKKRTLLENIAQSINTRAISEKAKVLARETVTSDLEKALNKEFQDLQAGHLKVILESSSTKGQTRHRLRLALPDKFNLGKVLSEGEQRAIAIASFLAEVNITPGHQGIVFDDPVSSLDHIRRETVARRLAREATKRQVIIFTHDLYFLSQLIFEAGEAGVTHHTQMVYQGDTGSGISVEDLPFEGKGTKRRIGMIRDQCQKATARQNEGDVATSASMVRDGYRMLRDTWERAIEEILLNGSVMRFKKSIETNRLMRVSIESQDLQEIDKGMTKSSNFTHDRPLMAGVAIPTPSELLKDVQDLDDFRRRIEERLKKK